MSKQNIIIRKICRGKRQDRVTVPKGLKSDYVAIKPLEVNVFDAKKRYYK